MSSKSDITADLDIVLKRIRDLEAEIEKLKQAGIERKEKEKLLQELRELVSVAQEENVINIRISTTARGAIFRLKRGVWATLSKLHKTHKENFDLEKSKANWGRMASLIIRKINEVGLSEYPTKIILTYDVTEEDGKLVFRPKAARILAFEPASHILATFEEAEKEEIREEELKIEEEEE